MIATYRYHGPDEFSSARTVQIDEDTALWLARMCVGEAGRTCSEEHVRALVWCYLNRFFLHRARKKWTTFLYAFSRHSQPVNPRWRRGGDLALKYAGTKYTTPQKMDRRERISSLAWSDVSWEIEDTVLKFEGGTAPPPEEFLLKFKSRCSDFASYKNIEKKFPWGVDMDGNYFFENRNLIEGTVVVDHWG